MVLKKSCRVTTAISYWGLVVFLCLPRMMIFHVLGDVLEVWLGTNKESGSPLRVSIDPGVTDVGWSAWELAKLTRLESSGASVIHETLREMAGEDTACVSHGRGCHLCPDEEDPMVLAAGQCKRITKGCDVIAYMVAFFPPTHGRMLERTKSLEDMTKYVTGTNGEWLTPRHGMSACYIIIANEASSIELKKKGSLGPWNIIVVNDPLPYENLRRSSKIPKILPHLFFPNASFTVYIDFKFTTLLMDPRDLVLETLVSTGAAWASWWHPWANTSGPASSREEELVFQEMRMIQTWNKSNELPALLQQEQRYRKYNKHIWRYVDSAILVRRVRDPFVQIFSCEWYSEVSAGADRDQPAIGFTLTRFEDAVSDGTMILLGQCISSENQWIDPILNKCIKQGSTFVVANGVAP